MACQTVMRIAAKSDIAWNPHEVNNQKLRLLAIKSSWHMLEVEADRSNKEIQAVHVLLMR